MPPAKHFEEHPEWYSLIDGKRTAGTKGQLCLTNEEMKKVMIANVLEWCRQRPEYVMVSVSQMDWGGYCQCEKCSSLAEKEGSQSGPVIHLVNAVAAEVEKEFPNMTVGTLAYQYTRKPPRHVKPRDNVVIRLCSIESDFLRPLDSEYNASFRDQIKGWRKIAKHLYIWDYTINFHNFIYPHPNLHVLADNLRFFADNNAYSVFEQGNGYSIGGEFQVIKTWVIGHLLWNPYRDGDELIKEFVNGYYGKAAPFILDYIELIRKAYERDDSHLSCFSQNAKFMTLKDMNQATQLFADAIKAAGDDKQLLTRLRRAKLPVDHFWLINFHDLKTEASLTKQEFTGPKNVKKAFKEFKRAAYELKSDYQREGSATLDKYLPDFEERIKMPQAELPAKTPPQCEKLTPQDWVDLQDSTLVSWGGKFVRDPQASNKRAICIVSTAGKRIEYRPEKMHSYRCYVVVRCESKAKTGPAFSIGTYDAYAATSTDRIIPLKQASDGKYHTYDIGVHKLKGKYLFVTVPDPVNDAVKAVYVDRFFIVKED